MQSFQLKIKSASVNSCRNFRKLYVIVYHQTPKQACLLNISESSPTINCILGKTLQSETQHGHHRAWVQEIMPVFTEVDHVAKTPY